MYFRMSCKALGFDMMPWLSMFDHGIQNSEQLTHTSGNGHFLWFALSAKALVKGSDRRIVAGGHQRTHVEGDSHSRSPAPD